MNLHKLEIVRDILVCPICGNDNIHFDVGYGFSAKKHSAVCRECDTKFWVDFYVQKISVKGRSLHRPRPRYSRDDRGAFRKEEAIKIRCGKRNGPFAIIKKGSVEWIGFKKRRNTNIRKGVNTADVARQMKDRLDAIFVAEAMEKAE